MNMWKKLTFGAVSIVAAVALTGCGANNANTSKELNVPIATDVATLDPSLATDSYSGELIGNTQAGLTRVNAEGKVVNELAKSIDVSSDGLTYTIELKDNLKWSNGDAITAENFVYSWQRAVDPKTASQYAYIMDAVKNATQINAGEMSVDELGIKAEGDNKLVVTLDKPTPYFDQLLSFDVYMPQDKKVVDEYGKAYGTTSDKMVYSGAYMFKKENGWNGTNKTFTIYKNPNYWDKDNVKTEAVNFQVISDPNTMAQLYKQGKLDLTTLGSADLYNANKSNAAYTAFKEATSAYMEYNQSGKGASSAIAQKALENQKIREAINLATNRAGLVEQISPASTPATSLTPANTAKTESGEDFADFAKQPYTFDAKKAEGLFKEGLKEIGETSLTLELETDSDSPLGKQSADFLQQNLQQALPGLTITEKLVPFQQRLKDSQTGNFDMVISLWGGDYGEPSTFLQLFTTGNSYNNGKFSNADYDKAYKNATTSDVMNATKRFDDYKEAESALYAQSNINPLYFRTTPALVNKDVIDFHYSATGLNRDYKEVYKK